MLLNLNLLLPTLPPFICWVKNSTAYKYTLKLVFGLLTIFSQLAPVSAQTVSNGNFDNQASSWGCNPEATHRESTYGGSSSTNRVAEVDKQAGLCQTISGFTVGNEYALSFKCSRRTTCGPTLQTMDVTVNGGALSQTVSRNGGGFNFTTETFNFVATATSHTLTFTGTVSGTCGLIVDDIQIEMVSALPVELSYFNASLQNDEVEVTWETAMELNNDYFTIERSTNGYDWNVVTEVNGAGNSIDRIQYTYIDVTPISTTTYYRLKQTDFDGSYTYSNIVSVETEVKRKATATIYPNPAINNITVTEVQYGALVKVFNSTGQDITHLVQIGTMQDDQELSIDVTNLPTGLYRILTNGEMSTFTKI